MTTGIIVTTLGKQITLNRLFTAVPTYASPSKFKIGMGTTTPASADTGLATQIPVTKTQIDTCDATTGWTANADCTLAVTVAYYKTSTGALSLAKTGGASADVNIFKTTTSFSLTSKEAAIWVYVGSAGTLAKMAVANCLTIRLGSASGDYYQWTKNASDLVVGWNLISGLTIATASVTGVPVPATIVYTFVQFTSINASDTWAVNEAVIDDIKAYTSATDGSDFNLALTAGYPSLDYTSMSSETRAQLSAAQAEGYILTEFGFFNADSPNKIFSRAVHTAIAKTSQNIIIYIEKDKII